MGKRSLHITMQLIADILSFQSDNEKLKFFICNNYIDWDSLVVVGSQHLMLPAIYCRLKEKKLINLVPLELKCYLEEVTAINRNRNKKLKAEAYVIGELLNKENIEYVFIKGMALILGNLFNDMGERMVGDIDILVAEKDIYKAFELLKSHGYSKVKPRNYHSENARHMERQISPDKYGAVELHHEILHHSHKQHLNREAILKNKIFIDNIPITNLTNSIKIAILALQINDKAHFLGYISFKTIYDCFVLKLPSQKDFLNELSINPKINSFLELSSILLPLLKPYNSTIYSSLLKKYFIFRLNNPKLGRLAYSLFSYIMITHRRISLFIINKSYRSYILKEKVFGSI